MRKFAIIRLWMSFGIAGTVLACASAVAQTATAISPQRAMLTKYCVTCHNEKLRTAGLLLDKVDVDHVSQNIPIWEKVAHKLRVREMPPAGAPRPDAATYDSTANYLETELDNIAAASPNPGRPVIHRLNRAEYTNAVRDLVALDVDTSTLLPADDAGYGFDNIGDVLTVSPMLIERYLSTASRVSRLAVGDPTLSPQVTTYQIPHARVQQTRESDDLPFGSRGGVAIKHTFPLDAEYIIQVKLQRNKGDDIMGLNQERNLDVRLDDARVKLFTFGGESKSSKKLAPLEKYEQVADQELEVRFFAKAGPHTIGVTFLKDTVLPEGILDKKENRAFFEGVGSVAVVGPYDSKGPGDTPSRRKIFVCHPATPKEEDPCARKIIGNLARAAYRRPITSEDMPTLLIPYKDAKSIGGFEAGIKMALQRILVSPEFIFRIEQDPAGAVAGRAYHVNDRDMASRLSFFLWSTIPDDELLGLADKGKLNDPVVLQQQVKRMLADPRAKTLVTNFVGQWLYLRNIKRVLPDPVAFPDFDENLRSAFLEETQLFFQSMLQEDRSVVDLLRANYTFVNERLARHYGIPNIHGSEFRRVTLTDESRQGLLGQGSLLTVTSYANRTSPTLRGKWVLENILGSPPPPPPPNVPSLKDDKGGRSLTMRQRMEMHRQSPVCSSCHSRMDPLGFALENFDGLGRWRSASGYPSVPVDASGVLPDGTKFDGPSGLRQVLLKKQDQFISTFTERLLTYAMGRGVEPYDAPTIRKIVRDAEPSDYKWSAIITGIVNSMPFQMRRAK